MIYESSGYLSLKSQKEKLAQNILKNYETLLEFFLGSEWKNKGSTQNKYWPSTSKRGNNERKGRGG